jgi:hypothetical protein
MLDARMRLGSGDGLTLGRRLRILRHRTARWFLPPVRPLPLEPWEEAAEATIGGAAVPVAPRLVAARPRRATAARPDIDPRRN